MNRVQVTKGEYVIDSDYWLDGLDVVALAALSRSMELWRGTPYAENSRKCQVCADCVGLMFGLCDTLYGHGQPTEYPRLRRDAGMVEHPLVDSVLKAFTDAFPCRHVKSGPIRAGSLVLVRIERGTTNGRENHALLTALELGSAMHAGESGAAMAALAQQAAIVSVFQLEEVNRWNGMGHR